MAADNILIPAQIDDLRAIAGLMISEGVELDMPAGIPPDPGGCDRDARTGCGPCTKRSTKSHPLAKQPLASLSPTRQEI